MQGVWNRLSGFGENIDIIKMEFLIGSEKQFIEFMSNLEAKDKIALVSHNDVDGICSALIVSNVVGGAESIEFLGYSYNMLAPLVERFKKSKINKVVITDLAIDREAESIKKLEKFADILIIDHHELLSDLNSKKTTMIKTISGLPASYVCYKLFSKINKIPSWIGIIGTLSDNIHKYDSQNADELFDDFEFDSERGNFYDKAILLSNAMMYFRGNELKVFDLIKDIKDFSELDKLKEYSDSIEEEIKYFLEDFEKNKEERGDLVFYPFNPKYPITSALINILSVKDKDKTYVFVTERKGLVRVSSRSQRGDVDCPELLRKASAGIPNAVAGGHFKAAGATIPSQYLNKFRENLFKAYGE